MGVDEPPAGREQKLKQRQRRLVVSGGLAKEGAEHLVDLVLGEVVDAARPLQSHDRSLRGAPFRAPVSAAVGPEDSWSGPSDRNAVRSSASSTVTFGPDRAF